MIDIFFWFLSIVLTFIIAYAIGHSQGYRDAVEAHVPDIEG